MFLGLISSIHITGLPKVALRNVYVLAKEKFQDRFITVKAVM
jgi:hypothetical protein